MKINLGLIHFDIGFIKLNTWRKKLAWCMGVTILIFCGWLMLK